MAYPTFDNVMYYLSYIVKPVSCDYTSAPVHKQVAMVTEIVNAQLISTIPEVNILRQIRLDAQNSISWVHVSDLKNKVPLIHQLERVADGSYASSGSVMKLLKQYQSSASSIVLRLHVAGNELQAVHQQPLLTSGSSLVVSGSSLLALFAINNELYDFIFGQLDRILKTLGELDSNLRELVDALSMADIEVRLAKKHEFQKLKDFKLLDFNIFDAWKLAQLIKRINKYYEKVFEMQDKTKLAQIGLSQDVSILKVGVELGASHIELEAILNAQGILEAASLKAEDLLQIGY